MTTDTTLNKIRAHLIEFPDDRPAHIAQVFGVPVSSVYDVTERLRRKKMLPRKRKIVIARRKAAKLLEKVPEIANNPGPELYELATLRAEIVRLNAIISYLEAAAGLKKAE